MTSSNSMSKQILSEKPSIEIKNETGEKHIEYEVLEIVDCKKIRKFGLQYKVTFAENGDDGNANPLGQFGTDFEKSIEKILKFHEKNPNKSKLFEEFLKAIETN